MKVPVAKLEALEADRFDLLPDAVFARALGRWRVPHAEDGSAPRAGQIAAVHQAPVEGQRAWHRRAVPLTLRRPRPRPAGPAVVAGDGGGCAGAGHGGHLPVPARPHRPGQQQRRAGPGGAGQARPDPGGAVARRAATRHGGGNTHAAALGRRTGGCHPAASRAAGAPGQPAIPCRIACRGGRSGACPCGTAARFAGTGRRQAGLSAGRRGKTGLRASGADQAGVRAAAVGCTGHQRPHRPPHSRWRSPPLPAPWC